MLSSDEIKPVVVLGGLDHTHLFLYDPNKDRYGCVSQGCFALLASPIPEGVHYIRRGDYVVVVVDNA